MRAVHAAALTRSRIAGLLAGVLLLLSFSNLAAAWARSAGPGTGGAAAPWLEVCTARSPLAGLGKPDGGAGGATQEHHHCPWCHFGQPVLGAPPAPLGGLAPVAAEGPRPPRALPLPGPAPRWRRGPVRGPPSFA